ncbi:MAG: lysylphosphatidylglycerol synthase transmembrane domain-containing protein [Bacillota bacterium]
MRINHKQLLFRVLPWFGVLILIVFLSRIDWGTMGRVIRQVNPFLVLLAFSFSFIYIAGKSIRWSWILKRQNIFLSFWEALGIYYATFYLSLLTPGKIGDVSKFFYLKGRGVPGGRALVSILLDRIYDLIFLCLMTVITMFFIPNSVISGDKYIVWVFIIGLGVLVSAIFFLKYRNIIKRYLIALLPGSFQEIINTEGKLFIDDLKKIGWRRLTYLFNVTIVLWMIAYLQIWILAMALGLYISYITIIFLSTIVSLLAILPVSPSGTNIGTRDAALVAGFFWFKIGTSEEALALSMLILLTIAFDAVCGYIAFSRVHVSG